jgi:threonine dehydrogenase-like Zn-dependent dehydrogenase
MGEAAMKAVFYEAPYKVDVHEAPRPQPGPHEVVVRVAACGICGTDQQSSRATFSPPIR